MNNRKPREIAVGILERAAMRQAHVEELLADALPGLAPVDRALCQELVLGVIRWQAALDWLITRRTQGRPQKPRVQILLRLGLYQLLWLDRIPDHAVVFETVEQARQSGFGPQSGFVNALLRGYAREREATRTLLEEQKDRDPAIGWSHPRWLLERWRARWGEASCRALLEWNNRPAQVYARVNTLRTEAGRLLEYWRMQENVSYEFTRWDWVEENLIFRLTQHPPLGSMTSLQQGWFYVQDPSTLLAVVMLDPQPGERILDLCAAPGGKTTYIAQRVHNEARVVAQDNVAGRLHRLQENCRRLGVSCVETETGLGASGERFDRVLVDAPCSNTGVIRRRAELRWRVTPVEVERLQRAQLKLLEQAAARLRSGGWLVYSTCSLEPEENSGVVGRFLQEHAEFRKEAERELLPFRDGVDGAYVACLRSS